LLESLCDVGKHRIRSVANLVPQSLVGHQLGALDDGIYCITQLDRTLPNFQFLYVLSHFSLLYCTDSAREGTSDFD
jgi:hypothetical protein